ncbi:MAG: tRNA (adenosine(37)-N6)-threonylcarbamoyltransferase complex transferase subunit TsaD [Bdellovibrionales bacterium]
MTHKNAIILGIESSCDETAAALVAADKSILAEALASQMKDHVPFGGVVPEVAARAHLLHLQNLINICCEKANIRLQDVDAIAATCGPGLIGGVMVGAMMGKALAASMQKPFLAINHLAAHALSPRLVADIKFPFLLLLVSGGHCQLLVVHNADKFQRLGTTIDDAAGEAFDKVARLLGLGYPGGPVIERTAKEGSAKRFSLPVPMLGRAEAHFSFSGLKTAVRLQVEKLGTLSEQDVRDMAASFQAAVVHSLNDRTARALQICREQNIPVSALVVAGGVAANTAIREDLTALATQHDLPFIAPPLKLCTDNATMVAWAGHERLALGLKDNFDIAPRPRWPLDPEAELTRGRKA